MHMKGEIPKFFGSMVTNVMKEIVKKSISRYQIGAIPGHRSQEHIFSLRSLISLYNDKLKKPIIVSLYDLTKFFDRENLVDAMDALYSCGVVGKIYRLIYMLNKDTVIEVKTPVGTTEKAETGENVGQGTIDGAIVSSMNIAKGVEEVFEDSKEEITYGGEALNPLLL